MRLPVVDEGTRTDSDIGAAVEEEIHTEIADEVTGVDTIEGKIRKAKLQGFTGSICTECGSTKMKRNGSCELCLDCGGTSGCS
jgi:ribonucleoside-diphosphate reductase alpha chain